MFILKNNLVINYPHNVKVDINTNEDSVYVSLIRSNQVFTVEHDSGILLDYTISGELAGLELLQGRDLFPIYDLTIPDSELREILIKVNSHLVSLWGQQ